MNENFLQSGCQEFSQSQCQNRNNGMATFVFEIDINADPGTIPPIHIGLNVVSFNNGTDANMIVYGTIDTSETLSGTWTITANGSLCGSYANGQIAYTSQVVGGIYVLNFAFTTIYIQGGSSSANGTFASCPIISPGVFGPPSTTLQVNGNASFSPNSGEAVFFFIGKTPAELPSSNFVPATYNLAIIPNMPC